jgi:uncharacterized protein
MKEIIETIARAIVDEPEVVSAAELDGAHTSIPAPGAAESDMGEITGKQGSIAGPRQTV